MNNLANNPDFMKRMANAVEFEPESTSVWPAIIGFSLIALILFGLYRVFTSEQNVFIQIRSIPQERQQ